MAKKVFNKRLHRIRRKLERRTLTEIKKASVLDKIKKAMMLVKKKE